MTSFYVVIGVVAVVGVAWLGQQLLRRSISLRLHALFGLVAFWLLSWPFGVTANTHSGWLGLDAMSARTIEHVMRLLGAYCLMVFITATSEPSPRGPRTDALRRLIPLAVAVAALLVDTALIPVGLRDEVAAVANGTTTGPRQVGVPTQALFFIIENAYFVIAFIQVARWAGGRLHYSLHPQLRRGIQIVQAGAIGLVVATALLITSDIVDLTGHHPAPPLDAAGLAIMAAGIVVVIAGFLWPSIRSGLRAFVLRGSRRKVYDELEPLWTRLNLAFPGNSLADVQPAARLRTRVALPSTGRGITHRYYRRVVECRDGLVLLTPYLDAVDHDTAPDPCADALYVPTAETFERALAAHQAGTPVDTIVPTRTVAATPGTTVDDDAEALRMLARQLRT